MGTQAQRNMVNSDDWKKDEVHLLKTMKLWSKTLGHAIDPSIYKGKKDMEKIVWGQHDGPAGEDV